MKILSAEQMQAWDAFTIAAEQIQSIDLMERAAQQCTNFIIENNLVLQPIKIFCGKGNNGGDGLAIARQLIGFGFKASVYIMEFGAKGTEDFQKNLQRLHDMSVQIHFIQAKAFFPSAGKDEIIIDALFGSGLNRPLEGLNAELVEHLNKSAAKIISIDIPSGMSIDKSFKNKAIVKAAYTLTFQSFKLCFLIPENADFFGEVKILDIGLSADFLSTIETTFELTTEEKIKNIYKQRKDFSHKGTFGHALLIAGNTGKMGAAIIAARACLRSGIGLLTVDVKTENLNSIQTAVPEAMYSVKNNDELQLEKFNAIGIGPGTGTSDEAIRQLQKVIQQFSKPALFDADALTILSINKGWLDNIYKGSIITPHPKEFDRLFGTCYNDFERIDKAILLSKEYPFIIVLKGHYTAIITKGKSYFNTTGNSGMATGGSGDMLSGIITSLLAQQYEPLDAAILGVYIHGLSGDLALGMQSKESLLPSDMIENLGNAFNNLV